MFSFAGDTILDPFAGTGTTAIAALNAGRNSISVEIEPKYVAMTRDRLREATWLRPRQALSESAWLWNKWQRPPAFICFAPSKVQEFQILRFRATNVAPFPFEWVDLEQTSKEYGALLIRISREYDRRFP